MPTQKLRSNYVIEFQHNYFINSVNGIFVEADDGKDIKTLYIKINPVDFAQRVGINLSNEEIIKLKCHGGEDTLIALRKSFRFIKDTGYSKESTIFISAIDDEYVCKITETL